MRQQGQALGYSFNRLYKAIGWTKQGFDQAKKRQKKKEQQLNELIILMDILRSKHPGCGLKKAYDTLAPDFVGRDRFIDNFMELGYRVEIKKRTIKTTLPGDYKYTNFIEGMIVSRINQVVQSDITYILVNEIFYYAIFIIDVYSKRIVGHQVSENMRVEANIRTLKQMIKLRGKSSLNGCIHHSDRGSQYGSLEYKKLLKSVNCLLSMDRSAEKNAYAERINGIIKNEYLKFWAINTFEELKLSVNKAVKHYNEKRIHRHLPGKLAPNQFEKKWKTSTKIQQHCELIHQTNNFVSRSEQKHLFNNLETTNGNFCPVFIQ